MYDPVTFSGEILPRLQGVPLSRGGDRTLALLLLEGEARARCAAPDALGSIYVPRRTKWPVRIKMPGVGRAHSIAELPSRVL